MKVHIHGQGKLGSSLALALRKAGSRVTTSSERGGLPSGRIVTDIVVLAVRDRLLSDVAARLVEGGHVSRKSAVVHVAGALGTEPLASLRPHCAGVAQMHPMISFAAASVCPSLRGGHCHVQGDPAAVAQAKKLCRLVGLIPRTFPELDTVTYHAAAGLVANGSAALAALGVELLVRAGVPRRTAPHMLGPLLRTVADNVERIGFPAALTGPVRRGELTSLARHFAILGDKLPEAQRLYLASAEAQLPLARALGDAPAAQFDDIATWLASTAATTS